MHLKDVVQFASATTPPVWRHLYAKRMDTLIGWGNSWYLSDGDGHWLMIRPDQLKHLLVSDGYDVRSPR